jgi:DNA-directed RNA polymerase specialized sigma24 family protein
VQTDELSGAGRDELPDAGPRETAAGDSAGGAGVAALYQAHAVGLIRLAVIMLGDRAAAEDVVQEAFYGLYRRWDYLSDASKALSYVRSAVLNRCRSELRNLRSHYHKLY